MSITNNVKSRQSYTKQLKLTKYFKDNSSDDGILTRNSSDNACLSSVEKQLQAHNFFPWLRI